MATNKNQGLDVNSSISKSEAFVEKNKKPLLIGLGVIIILIAGFFLYKTYVEKPREAKASTLLAKGQDYFSAGDFDKAVNGDNAGWMGFVRLSKEYGSTDAGNLAKLYAGLSYAQQGKAQEAVKYLESYSTAGDEMIEPAAIGALGNCYAKLNQLDKAVSTLKKAASTADNNSLSPIYLIQAGEILESQNKTTEAIELYKEVKEKYYMSAQAEEIDKYIERASVKAGK